MESRFSNTEESVKRLFEVWKKHQNLIIAFDFDDTVFDYHKRGDSYNLVIDLLKECDSMGFTLICFSGVQNMKDVHFKSEYINQVLGLRVNGTRGGEINKGSAYKDKYNQLVADKNELPAPYYNKPMFNILLDDKAGLGEAYKILQKTLYLINSELEKDEELLNSI